jgi:hypothetical protein
MASSQAACIGKIDIRLSPGASSAELIGRRAVRAVSF